MTDHNPGESASLGVGIAVDPDTHDIKVLVSFLTEDDGVIAWTSIPPEIAAAVSASIATNAAIVHQAMEEINSAAPEDRERVAHSVVARFQAGAN